MAEQYDPQSSEPPVGENQAPAGAEEPVELQPVDLSAVPEADLSVAAAPSDTQPAPSESTSPDDEPPEDDEPARPGHSFVIMKTIPSWLVSLVVHTVILNPVEAGSGTLTV